MSDVRPATKPRKYLGRIVRLAICASAIAWLANDLQWAELRDVLRTADPGLAALAILMFGPALFLIAQRLRWLLDVNHIHLTYKQSLRVTFGGNFVIQALPVGTSGGDAVKAFYIARDTPRKHEAIITVFFDRVVGVVSLLGISGVVVLLNWRDPQFQQWGRVIGITTITLLVGTALYFSYRVRVLIRMDEIVNKLPMSAHFRRLDAAVFAFRGRMRTMFAVAGFTLLLHGFSIISVWLAGCALGLTGGDAIAALPVYLGYVPICFLAGGLPLGVMEAGYAELFAGTAQLGSVEAAVLLSIFTRLIQLLWALPGALVFLKSGKPTGSDLDDEPATQASS